MRIHLLLAACVLSLIPVSAVRAQQVPAASARADERVNVDRLPLDLARLERQIRRPPAERERWDGFRLNYTVEVFGAAPKLQLFEPKDVLPGGPIPYGAPTHREMVDVMTPREYRAPGADLSSLMRWLEQKLK